MGENRRLIGIVPASTKVGTATTRALLNGGHRTVGFWRHNSSVPQDLSGDPLLQQRHGDISNPESLDFSGIHAILAITPPCPHDCDSIEWTRRVSENIKQAIQKAGCTRLVFLSSLGAEHPSGTGEIMTNHVAESVLKNAAPEVLFLRCGYFMENWETAIPTVKSEHPHFYSPITPLDFEVPMVSIYDISQTCSKLLSSLDEDAFSTSPRIIELRGPAPCSVNDVQRALSIAANAAVEVRPIEKDKLTEFFSQFLPQPAVGRYVEMTTAMLPGGILAQTEKSPSKVARVEKGNLDIQAALSAMYQGRAYY